VLLPLAPQSTIVRPIDIHLDTKSVFRVILEATLVNLAIRVDVLALPFTFLVAPRTFIIGPVRVDQAALAMNLSIAPLAIVE